MTDWEETYKDLKRRNWVILLLLGSLSAVIMDHAFTLGIILGGIIAILNFDVLQRIISGAFSGEHPKRPKKMLSIGIFYLRFILIGIIIFFLIRRSWLDPIGLTIGLSIVVIGIVSFGISNAFKARRGEAT